MAGYGAASELNSASAAIAASNRAGGSKLFETDSNPNRDEGAERAMDARAKLDPLLPGFGVSGAGQRQRHHDRGRGQQ